MNSNPFSAAFRGVKKKIDRHGDGSQDGKRHNDPLLHLSHKKLRKTTPEQLERYSNAELEALPPDRIEVLHEDVLARLDSRVLAKLPGEVIARLSPATQLRLSPKTIARLPIDILATVHSEVLCHALVEIRPEDLCEPKLRNAVVQIGHQRLQQLDPNILENLGIELASPKSQQLPIQKHDTSPQPPGISLHPSGMKLLPPVPQSTHDFEMPEGYLDNRQQQQQQPGVTGFNAYNTAGIDQTAFSNSNPPSPTYAHTGRSSPGAARSLANCQSTTYHPPRTSDHRPSYGPRRNSSVSKGSHSRARSSSRSRRPDGDFKAYTPGAASVTYVEPGPINYAQHHRVVSETPMGLPTPPLRSSSRVESYDLSPSEVIKRVETGTWKEDHQQIPRKETPRKETPKASRESIANIKEEDSLSLASSPTTTSPTASPKPSPAVASFAEHAERKRASTSLGHHHTTSSPTLNASADNDDDDESDHTNQAIQNHIIKTLKAERDALNKQLVQAKAENIALLDPLVKYLNRKIAGKKHESDGIVDAVIAYCQEICDVNTRNLDACRQWEDRYLSEKKLREEKEDQLEDKARRLRSAEDNLPVLQSRVSELETRESSLNNEIARLEREKSTLERKCENQDRRFETQKAQSDAAIKRLEHEHQTETFQLQQTVASHDAQLRQQKEHYEKKLSDQKEDLAQKMQRQREYYDSQINALHAQLSSQSASHEAQLAQATADLQSQLATLRSTHKAEKDQLEATFTSEFASLQASHAQTITSLQATHAQELASLAKEHTTALARLKRQHTHATKSLHLKVQSLENDLVGNNDDFRPATDDSLKVSFRQLKLCVDMVTEPNNLGISGLPKNVGRVDTTRFLEREGKNQLRFLLRSLVWQRVVEGFFSEPFGMGALGPRDQKGGGGWETLRGVVEGWRGLCGYSTLDGQSLTNGKAKPSPDTDLLTPFYHSREANKWRSALFQSILTTVVSSSSSSSPSSSSSKPTANSTPYHTNLHLVQTNLLTLLSSFCPSPSPSSPSSPGTLAPEITSKVTELCLKASELALQFGAQRALLALEVPRRGDLIKIGSETGWVDCEDGDTFGGRKGVEVEVELCVSPKVYRVGDMDGRNLAGGGLGDKNGGGGDKNGGDKKGKVKVVVAGEVYPRRS